MSPIPQRTTDIRDNLRNVFEDLEANLAGGIPVIGPFAAAAMHFRNGIFRAVEDSENGLLNGVIDDINARHEQLKNCMNERIDLAMVEIHVNEMKRAFVLYNLAAYVPGSDGRARKEKLKDAWNQYMLTANVEFGNVDKSATYFKEVLHPAQNFAQSFVLCATDYLIHLKALNDGTYDLIFSRTISSFEMLRTWTLAARNAILADVERTRQGFSSEPCRNGAAFAGQVLDWRDKFSADNMHPLNGFIDDLDEANYILSGSYRPRPYVVATPATNWRDQGSVCSSRFFFEYGMIRSEAERASAVQIAGFDRVWTGLHWFGGQWRWWSTHLCVGAPGMECKRLPWWAPGQPSRDGGCAYLDDDGLLYVGDCGMQLPGLCTCIGAGAMGGPCAER